MTRKTKNLFRTALLVFILPLAVGCGGVVGEVAAVVTVVKLVAIGATAVLTVAGTYWLVESARLDAAKRQLILEGMKDGEKTTQVINLEDEQLATIERTGELQIEFSDGRTATVKVKS